MRSIKSRFEKIKEKNPGWGHYYCFVQAVSVQRFSRDVISRQMKELLVEGYDYEKPDKKALLRELEEKSNTPEETENRYKLPQG